MPVGDPTLSAREIIGNESQERMGLVLSPGDEELLVRVAERERAPMYDVGEVTGDQRFEVVDTASSRKPIDLHLADPSGNRDGSLFQPRVSQADSDESVVHGVPHSVLAGVDVGLDRAQVVFEVGIRQLRITLSQVR